MNKVDSVLLKFVTFAVIPVVILLMWGSTDDPVSLSMSSGVTRLIWDFLGWILMFWIASMLYVVIKMVIVKSFRESILSRVARIKERDEREGYIAGEAAKFSVLSTLAVMFLLLFFSLFTVKVGKYPEGSRGPDKHGFISIGMNFHPFATDKKNKEVKSDGQEIFSYTGLPLSSSVVMILMIFWQLGSYQVVVRRLGHDEN